MRIIDDPIFVESFLEKLRCAYRKGKYLKVREDFVVALGHHSGEITLADNNTYEEIYVYQKQSSDILVNDYQYTKVNNRHNYKWGSVFEIDLYGDDNAKSSFDNFLQPTEVDYSNQLSQYIAKILDPDLSDDEIEDLLNIVSWCAMEKLNAQDRLRFIEFCAEGSILEQDENIILDLLKSTPSSQVPDIIAGLKTDGLLADLFSKIHDIGGEDNFRSLAIELTKIYYQQGEENIKTEGRQLGEDRLMVWDSFNEENWTRANYSQSISEEGEVTITATVYPYDPFSSVPEEVVIFENVDPFESVGVQFLDDLDFIQVPQDKVVVFPAIYVAWIVKEYQTQNTIQAIELSLNFTAFAFGIVELNIAATPIRVALGATELAFSVSDIIISQSICQGSNGQTLAFCEDWNEFSMIANVLLLSGNILADVPMLATKVSNSWDELEVSVRNSIADENPEIPRIINEIEEAIDLGSGGESFFKSVDDFALTFDKTGNVSQTIRQQAFDLYKSKNWNALEELFSNNNLNDGLPPANGGYNILDDVPISAGQKFDRYGGSFGEDNGNPKLVGAFTSPVNNNTPYSFEQRALNGTESTYDLYYEIEVLQDLPFKAQNADVIPWFGQPGGGKQSMWKIPIDDATGYPKTWNKLAEEGYIKITIKDSPSGNFSSFVGIIIQN